jgi:hypothetical protein
MVGAASGTKPKGLWIGIVGQVDPFEYLLTAGFWCVCLFVIIMYSAASGYDMDISSIAPSRSHSLL